MSKQTALKLAESIEPIDLKKVLRTRFLWYAISTIASRALPDVRDGLKPVHRRLLYAMYKMGLTPDKRYRKCAAVVGDVLGKYHPHGDQAAYDALVRLAQHFSMRHTLVDGQGNFGSIDGDNAAAMRYTESRLTPIAMEILREIEQETVPFRPNYDATLKEPIFLPSRFPNLLVNGSSGIAVGMATNIPPHNLSEVIDALIALIGNPSITLANIQKYIKGPDFPTGAGMVTSKKELRDIYKEGKGSIKVRGDYKVEELKRGRKQIIITSLPYVVNKSRLVEKIASLIIDRKMPAIDDVRDESTEDIRVVLELKGSADVGKVMAYIYRYTDMESNFAANFTALDVNGAPRRMPLLDILNIFIEFRVDTTERRLKYDLKKVLERLHILRALLKVLKDLDAAIAIIRKSKSRDIAKQGLKQKFRLDDIQASAVLDLRLSSLVSMEIQKVRLEAAELEAKREMLEAVLKSKKKIRGVVKKELEDIKKLYGDKRRTKLIGAVDDEEEYSVEDFVEHEQCYVIVSRNGWLRRIKTEPKEGQLRFKEGDSLLKILSANTSDFLGFFSTAGKVYVTRAYDMPATTGFGLPVQSLFKFGDGERIVSVIALPHVKDESGADGEFLAVMENGSGLRFSRESIMETTRAGRRYANVKGDNAVLDIIQVEHPFLYIAHNGGKGLLIDVKEVPLLLGSGSGVKLIKIKKGDRLISVKNVRKKDSLRLFFDKGRDSILKVSELEKGKRASAGRSYGGLKKKLMGITVGG